MGILIMMLVSGIILYLAYRVVGSALARMFRLDDRLQTPAHTMRDGLDYEPIRKSALLPQHFSAIAAVGPIVGPILGALYFGWGPTWLWLILGSILIGGIHDFTAIVSSLRHGGRTVAELVRQHINGRAYILFLLFVWFALIYVVIAFADVTAATFVASARGGAGSEASGPAVATSSFLYLALALGMGLAQRYLKVKPLVAKLVFLPLVFVVIWLGQVLPLDLGGIFPALAGDTIAIQKTWCYVLLAYCLLAAMSPVWALLQPRGELGGYFMYIVMALGIGGILVGSFTGGGLPIQNEFFKGWVAPDKSGAYGATMSLAPVLFITIACGACSGFHSIVSSGTTARQLDRETDAKLIGYGGMVLEGFFACLSLATLMVLAPATLKPGITPNDIFATGLTQFAEKLLGGAAALIGGREVLYQFILMCFATFVFDTMDACTRLARYVFMELMNWHSRPQAWLATVLSLVLPVITVALPPPIVDGVAQPLWKMFWNIFGASNQLLAALTLLGVTMWLMRRRMNFWITLVPTLWMLAMSMWSLVLMAGPYVQRTRDGVPIEMIRHVQFAITLSLLVLSFWLIVEAIITWRNMKPHSDDHTVLEAAEIA